MKMMANLVYSLSALTSIVCALLLIRGYMRTRSRLLLWSSLCFVGLVINNLLLVLDRIFVPNVDLHTLRLVTALGAMTVLVYGLVWESK
jgi:hydrogenase/urease accessory protein HupE